MKRQVFLTCLLAIAGAISAGATTLYNNITATSFTSSDVNGFFQISGNGYWVADSFTIPSGSVDTITSVTFGNWIYATYYNYGNPTPSLSSVSWEISSWYNRGTNYGSGSANVSQNTLMNSSLTGSNQYGIESSFSITPVTLQPGTYYLDLSNVALQNSSAWSNTMVYWDEAGSSASTSEHTGSWQVSSISNTFALSGTDPSSSTPVPESSGPFDLCLSALVIGAATLFERGLHLHHA